VPLQFEDVSHGPLNGTYANINFGQDNWSVYAPSDAPLSSRTQGRAISFAEYGSNSGTLSFNSPSTLKQFVVINTSSSAATGTATCENPFAGTAPQVSWSVAGDSSTQVTTRWSGVCQGDVTLTASNGRSTWFDNLDVYRPVPTPVPTATPQPVIPG
jgi:hypothetical protein